MTTQEQRREAAAKEIKPKKKVEEKGRNQAYAYEKSFVQTLYSEHGGRHELLMQANLPESFFLKIFGGFVEEKLDVYGILFLAKFYTKYK